MPGTGKSMLELSVWLVIVLQLAPTSPQNTPKIPFCQRPYLMMWKSSAFPYSLPYLFLIGCMSHVHSFSFAVPVGCKWLSTFRPLSFLVYLCGSRVLCPHHSTWSCWTWIWSENPSVIINEDWHLCWNLLIMVWAKAGISGVRKQTIVLLWLFWGGWNGVFI